MRDRWHQRLNLTECEMFATMYKDAVHPSDTGRLLLVGGRLLPQQHSGQAHVPAAAAL
jgi:hypothetical protein